MRKLTIQQQIDAAVAADRALRPVITIDEINYNSEATTAPGIKALAKAAEANARAIEAVAKAIGDMEYPNSVINMGTGK